MQTACGVGGREFGWVKARCAEGAGMLEVPDGYFAWALRPTQPLCICPWQKSGLRIAPCTCTCSITCQFALLGTGGCSGAFLSSHLAPVESLGLQLKGNHGSGSTGSIYLMAQRLATQTLIMRSRVEDVKPARGGAAK